MASADGERRHTRTIPFEGDAAAALEEVQRRWSQLRANPLQINVVPAAGRPASLAPVPAA